MERLQSYDIASLQQKCHAFEKGCPFKHLVNEDFMKAVKKCPQFRDRWAFKDATTLTEIYEKLSQIPDPQSSSKNLRQLFTAMHSVSESLEQNLGDCPMFTPCCPLKTVQSAGVKLVESPESVSAEQLGQKEKFKAEISVGVIKFPPSINMKSYKREQRSDKLYFNIVNITRTRQYFHDVTQQAKPKKICI